MSENRQSVSLGTGYAGPASGNGFVFDGANGLSALAEPRVCPAFRPGAGGPPDGPGRRAAVFGSDDGPGGDHRNRQHRRRRYGVDGRRPWRAAVDGGFGLCGAGDEIYGMYAGGQVPPPGQPGNLARRSYVCDAKRSGETGNASWRVFRAVCGGRFLWNRRYDAGKLHCRSVGDGVRRSAVDIRSGGGSGVSGAFPRSVRPWCPRWEFSIWQRAWR